MSRDVFALLVRRLVLRRRTLALAAVALAACLPALGFRLSDALEEPQLFYARLLQNLYVPTVTAFVSLVLGVSALGDEREDGTILMLAATPLARVRLVISAILAAWVASVVLLAPALVLCAWLALGGELGAGLLGWPLVAVALGSLTYCALSVWLSMLVRRPVVVGLLYILLWEGSIATFAASADRLSVAAYARALVDRAVPELPDATSTPVSMPAALVVLLAVAAGATWLGGRALRRAELP